MRENSRPFHSITRLCLQVTNRARTIGVLSRSLLLSGEVGQLGRLSVGICLMGIEVVELVFCGAGGKCAPLLGRIRLSAFYRFHLRPELR